MKTQKQKLNLLDKTVKFYSENERCIKSNGDCVYWSESKPKGCAVGRMFRTESARKSFQGRSEELGVSSVIDSRIFELLPEYISDYGDSFLQRLQNFHDYSTNWIGKKLSAPGRKSYDDFKKDIETNKI